MKQNISFVVDGKYGIQGLLSHVNYEKIIILVHGFTGDMHGPDNLFDKLADESIQAGYSTFQFNFRGTPPSEMDFQDMTLETEVQDLQEVITFVKKQGYKNIALIGESMGVSVILKQKAFEDIRSLVLWYGAFDFIDTSFKNYLSKENTDFVKIHGFLNEGDNFKVGKDFIESIPSVKLLESVKNISCPVFFLHGSEDKDCSYKDSIKAYEIVPHQKKDIFIIGGEGHCLRTAHKEAILSTLNFLKKYF